MRKIIMLGLLLTLILFQALPALAEVDAQTTKQLNLKDEPLDMKFSRDGEWLYLLTEKGEVLVYDYHGVFKGKIFVGQEVDELEPGPFANEIYLLDRAKKQIRVVEITHTQKIDAGQAPYKGAADAPIVIVEFTDFQCPYCAKLGAIFDELLQAYPGKLKIVYKSFPLKNHKFAFRAATAAMAAHRTDRFWEVHDKLFEHYKELNEEKIRSILKELGLDTLEFNALMNDPKIRAQVAKDRNEGQKLGVRGTPTVFINGKRLKDKRLEGFKAAIEKELKVLKGN